MEQSKLPGPQAGAPRQGCDRLALRELRGLFITMHISESQRRENKSLHARDENYGTGGADWAAYLEQTMADESLETVLDYGCGKGTLAGN